MDQVQESENAEKFLERWRRRIFQWMKPDPADHAVLQVIKFILKSIVLLILIALSPVIAVIMLFVFFAAI